MTGLSDSLGRALRAAGITLAVAESCTGGMLAAAVTSVAGASDYFMGGVVAYHNDAKSRLLGVPAGLIVAEGAVSAPVALAMADGVRARFGTGAGVGITGIAGPGGGTPDKPVGTVWIAVSVGDVRLPHCFVFEGDRAQVREAATAQALSLLVAASGGAP